MSNRHTPETRDWFCPSCKGKVFASKGDVDTKEDQEVKKENDWKCPGCNGLVFASKDRCKCGTYKNGLSNRRKASNDNQKPGDWTCPGCNGLVFASKDTCRKCGTSKPGATPDPIVSNTNVPVVSNNNQVVTNNSGLISVANPSTTFKAGDWHCNCGAMNFASRTACYKCAAPKQ